jgi:hypothetical protein
LCGAPAPRLLLLLQFVTFSLAGIDVFSVNVFAAVLILIVGLDTFGIPSKDGSIGTAQNEQWHRALDLPPPDA